VKNAPLLSSELRQFFRRNIRCGYRGACAGTQRGELSTANRESRLSRQRASEWSGAKPAQVGLDVQLLKRFSRYLRIL